MPTFDTPEPITVTIDLAVANIRIDASDRTDTVVEVRPSDPGSDRDVRAAEQTRVEYADGRLTVRGPRMRPIFSSRTGAVDLAVELPTGSPVHGEATVADVQAAGRLGECLLKVHSGRFTLGEVGPARLYSGNGRIIADEVTGDAMVTARCGDVRIGRIDGTAVIKSSNGDTLLGEVTGGLRTNAANGDIIVEHAGADVTAKTANGDVRVAEVSQGSVSLETASGDVEVGIGAGSAAWLDLHSYSGRVLNSLRDADGPGQGDQTVQVRARNYSGDIVIRRAWRAPVD